MIRICTIPVLVLILTLTACKSTKTYVYDPVTMEEEVLDTLIVQAPRLLEEEKKAEVPYRASATRYHDLIHTKLDIAFDWKKQHVLGKAQLTLKPYFYETDLLELDAKTFDVHKVAINGKPLEYDYNQRVLSIKLDKVYQREETFTIDIDYTAKPNEGPIGGSSAITSNKGLFFINPESKNKFKPQQIWTQGETENSSKWFPTIDKPNERCTQEVHLTVKDNFQTLSNGKLISSTQNANGTRTDIWKQDKPHAPYLFMLGVGEYAVVESDWKGKKLLYYVEPAYEEHAEKIFNHTPEMLDFFSDLLGYPYPWDKYAQIVCRDYVSGAMENTGAVVFGDFVQKTTRELLDANNDDIVAHEMFHHWFGDLVTCESWSNLTLNEGFATYSEYLWQEYKYGHEAAERKRLQDLNGYLMTVQGGDTHDLIDFEFNDKEDMFDGHSYNKGGLIVHMLRNYVGDDAFFAALNKYLTDNEYTDVEAHELRLAFEDTCGEDLNWFFNQWFYDKGHPVLETNYKINASEKKVFIDVKQVQDPEDGRAIFSLPMKTALYYASGKVDYVDVWIDEAVEFIEIEIEGEELPEVVVLDGTHDILAVNKENRSDEEYVRLFQLSNEYEDKYQALSKLRGKAAAKSLTDKAITDPSEDIRMIAVNGLSSKEDAALLKKLAKDDPSSSIRMSCLKKLKDYDLALERIKNDPSYLVISHALEIVHDKNKEEGERQAEALSKSYSKPLISILGDIFASSKNPKYLDFFEENVNEVGMFSFFNFMGHYGKLAKEADIESIEDTAVTLKAMALEESNSYFKKYSSANLIRVLSNELQGRISSDPKAEASKNKLINHLVEIANTTSSEQLRSAFSEYTEQP